MSSRFMPEPSDQSIGAYRPSKIEHRKLLTSEIRCKIFLIFLRGCIWNRVEWGYLRVAVALSLSLMHFADLRPGKSLMRRRTRHVGQILPEKIHNEDSNICIKILGSTLTCLSKEFYIVTSEFNIIKRASRFLLFDHLQAKYRRQENSKNCPKNLLNFQTC